MGIFACAAALLVGCYESYFAVPDGDWDVFRPVDDARGDALDRGGDADADVEAESDTHVVLCGNGMADPGEGCDDGNMLSGDGCDAFCRVESGPDAGADADADAEAFDVGPCSPAPEVCNGTDDDCDGVVDDGDVCPCPRYEYRGHTYLFCTPQTTWYEARRLCVDHGYDLASINDADENSWVDSTVDTHSTERAWVGLTNETGEGTWIWINGDPVTYTSWEPWEPSGDGNCAQLNRFHPVTTWNDEPCTTPYQFVCESLEVEPPCVPECGGRECGFDGCGGRCGPGCAGDATCDEATGRCGTVLVEYAYSYCGCRGVTWMDRGDVFEIYNAPGGGPGPDVARCYLGDDGRLRAYNLDSVATDPVWGEAVESGCSVATFSDFVVTCCRS